MQRDDVVNIENNLELKASAALAAEIEEELKVEDPEEVSLESLAAISTEDLVREEG